MGAGLVATAHIAIGPVNKETGMTMIILTEWCKWELITKLLKKISTDVWRLADADLKIWIKITWFLKWSGCIKKWYQTVLTFFFFSGEGIEPYTRHWVFMVGRQGGGLAYPALLQSCGNQLLFSACLGLAEKTKGEIPYISLAPGAQGGWPATTGEGGLAAWLHLL